MPRTVIDVAGVAVALDADDAERGAKLRDALAGFAVVTAPPVATITIDAARVDVPSAEPTAESFGFRFWHEPGRVVVASRSAVVRATTSGITVHVADDDDLVVVEAMVPVACTWLLAQAGRYLVHGAAVASGGRALLVLGTSGAGKSTLAAAALEAGWHVLSDDLVVLVSAPEVVCIHGVHHPPAVPVELGGPVVKAGTPLNGPRRRAVLDRAVLASGGFELGGTIVVSHATAPDGTFASTGARRIVPLLLQSFAGTIDDGLRPAFFAFTERIAALPAWELGHAGDLAQRRAHVARALTQCAT
jgi:hypothetical protein